MLDQQLERDLQRDADLPAERHHERVEIRIRPVRVEGGERLTLGQADDRGAAELDLVGIEARVGLADRRLGAVIRRRLDDERGHGGRDRGVDLGVGIGGELLQELDHRRQIRHAAGLFGAQAIVEVKHHRQAGVGARGDALPFQIEDAQAARVLVGDVIGDVHAVAVDLHAAGNLVGIARALRIANAIGLDHLQLGAVGVAGILAVAPQHEQVARLEHAAIGGRLHLVHALHAREVAGRTEQLPLALLLALHRIGLLRRDAERLMINAGLQLEPVADDVGDVGRDGAGRDRCIARKVARAAAQIRQIEQRVGIGRAVFRPPALSRTPLARAAIVAAGAGRLGKLGARLRPRQAALRVERRNNPVDEIQLHRLL